MADVTIKDYQEWLKNNNKVKVAKEGEKLSTFDELENKALYNQYVEEAKLFNQRQQAESLLEKQKAAQLRDHYVAQENAQKQAQDTLKMQGITSGVSESGLIDLYAQGAAARSKIISDNDSAKNDIFSDYRSRLAELQTDTNTSIANIDAQRIRREEQEAEVNRLKEEQDAEIKRLNAVSQFSNLLDKYNEEGNDMDFEEIRSAYEAFSPYLDEVENYDIIDTYKKHLKDEEDAQAVQASKNALADAGVKTSDDTRSFNTIDKGYLGVSEDREKAIKRELNSALENGNIKEGETIIVAISKDLGKVTYYKDGRFYQGSTVGDGLFKNDFRMLKNAIVEDDYGYIEALKDAWDGGKGLIPFYGYKPALKAMADFYKMHINKGLQKFNDSKFVGE